MEPSRVSSETYLLVALLFTEQIPFQQKGAHLIVENVLDSLRKCLFTEEVALDTFSIGTEAFFGCIETSLNHDLEQSVMEINVSIS